MAKGKGAVAYRRLRRKNWSKGKHMHVMGRGAKRE